MNGPGKCMASVFDNLGEEFPININREKMISFLLDKRVVVMTATLFCDIIDLLGIKCKRKYLLVLDKV